MSAQTIDICPAHLMKRDDWYGCAYGYGGRGNEVSNPQPQRLQQQQLREYPQHPQQQQQYTHYQQERHEMMMHSTPEVQSRMYPMNMQQAEVLVSMRAPQLQSMQQAMQQAMPNIQDMQSMGQMMGQVQVPQDRIHEATQLGNVNHMMNTMQPSIQPMQNYQSAQMMFPVENNMVSFTNLASRTNNPPYTYSRLLQVHNSMNQPTLNMNMGLGVYPQQQAESVPKMQQQQQQQAEFLVNMNRPMVLTGSLSGDSNQAVPSISPNQHVWAPTTGSPVPATTSPVMAFKQDPNNQTMASAMMGAGVTDNAQKWMPNQHGQLASNHRFEDANLSASMSAMALKHGLDQALYNGNQQYNGSIPQAAMAMVPQPLASSYSVPRTPPALAHVPPTQNSPSAKTFNRISIANLVCDPVASYNNDTAGHGQEDAALAMTLTDCVKTVSLDGNKIRRLSSNDSVTNTNTDSKKQHQQQEEQSPYRNQIVSPHARSSGLGKSASPSQHLLLAPNALAMMGTSPRTDALSAAAAAAALADKRSAWKKEEDTLLMDGVQRFGTKKWAYISRKLFQGTRTGSQLRTRYTDVLCPNRQIRPWNKEEDLALVRLHDIHGNKWSLISQFMKDRVANDIKNRFRKLRKVINTANGSLPGSSSQHNTNNSSPDAMASGENSSVGSEGSMEAEASPNGASK